MSELPRLRISDVLTHPVIVPMKRPLRTSSGAVAQAPLLLIDLNTEEGITGRSYLFAYQPLALKPLNDLVRALAEIIQGQLPFDVERSCAREPSCWVPLQPDRMASVSI
jgi:mandelate racemase